MSAGNLCLYIKKITTPFHQNLPVYFAMIKLVLTSLLTQLINYSITSCIVYSSFPCMINIIYFFFPEHSFKKSMGNKSGGKRQVINQNTHLELNHSILYTKTAVTRFCPFPWTDVLIKKKIRT